MEIMELFKLCKLQPQGLNRHWEKNARLASQKQFGYIL